MENLKIIIFTTDELKALQYWFAMAHAGRAVNGFMHDDVDNSALEKIQEAIEERF
jgi:hypothetical protein